MTAQQDTTQGRPETPQSWQLKIKALTKQGDLAGAAAAAAEGVRLWPDDFDMVSDLARIVLRLSRWSEAVELTEQLTRAWPEAASGWDLHIRALSGAQQYAQAGEAIRHARGRWPDNEGFLHAQARMALRSRDWAQALAAGEELKRVAPEEPAGWRAAIQALLSLGEIEKAETDLEHF